MASPPQTIALVTGGNNGIGFYTCALFAAQAHWHVILASRSVEKGEKAVAQIRAQHPAASISLVQLDITSDASIAAAVEQVGAQHAGRLDVLVNNAGVCPTTVSRPLFRDTFDTNAISPALVTEAFAPLLAKSSSSNAGSGGAVPRVIYVSSALGSIGLRSDRSHHGWAADYKVYRMSKAALDMLVACDTWQYDALGVKTFGFCPGYVVSDLAGMADEKRQAGVQTPEGSARGLLAIAEGRRDAEAGKFLHGEEVGMVYPW